jgi:hypothetical protein
MSSNELYIKQRIPFKYIDKINSSIRKMSQIQVVIQSDAKSSSSSWMFKVNGDCPAYISSLNTGKKS